MLCFSLVLIRFVISFSVFLKIRGVFVEYKIKKKITVEIIVE